MEESKFQELMTKKSLAIVHFSHFAKMAHAVEFPCDLHHAINSFQSEARSCCAIWPGHRMNLPGSVGVIFEPKFEQVCSVLQDDSGSSDYGRKERSGGVNPSQKTILESLNVVDGRYNEWRVLGAKPIGIFVANTVDICVKKKVTLSCNGEAFEDFPCTSITLKEVFDKFPGMEIFTMGSGGLCPVTANGV